jgi:acetyl-CoA acetyltransferase
LRHALRRRRGVSGHARGRGQKPRPAYARISGTIERHNAFPEDPIQLRGGWAMDIDELYEMAGCGPEAIDLLQTYDDYPVISMMQFEDLGFCAKGRGGAVRAEHDLTITGDFPHNTSGGQLSAGQAGAAGGYLGWSRRSAR